MRLYQCAALALLTIFAVASESGMRIETARALYLQGVEGNRDASRDSLRMFEHLQQKHPDDMRILAYLGSVRVLESGRTMALWKRGKLAKEGLEALDRAVSSAPGHLEIRFLRAISTYHLPGYFNREKQCAGDLLQIATSAEKAAAAGTLDPAFAAAALFRHGLMLEKSGDRASAQQAWKTAVRISPGSRAAGEAGQRLKSR